ncbi:MAG: ATP-binding protein, partial [Firmicutes bacterium]|nr:ATP-binding protein [Bacillota bacterium]
MGRVRLKPLDGTHIGQVVSEALESDISQVGPLAEEVHLRSGGNPFHARQILQKMYEEGLLYFSWQERRWRWSFPQGRPSEIADSVVELVIERIRRLPERTGRLLQYAACIGRTFETQTLARACGQSPAEVSGDLWPAVRAGVLLPRDGPSKEVGGPGVACAFPDTYEFLHDRVLQAVHCLLSEEEEKEIHRELGRILLQETESALLERKVYQIADHLNRARELVARREERVEAAELNLRAARKAKAAVAFDEALHYLEAGRRFLPERAWEEYYGLTFDLHLELCQCLYLSRKEEAGGQVFEELLRMARTREDRAAVYAMRTVICTSTLRYVDAVRFGLKGLRELGLHPPARPGKHAILKEILLVKGRLALRRGKTLPELPQMKHPRFLGVIGQMASLLPVTSLTNPPLFALLILKMFGISLKYGNTMQSSLVCASYGLISAILGDLRTACTMQEAALQLVGRYPGHPVRVPVHFTVASFLSHWKEHLHRTLTHAVRAYESAIECGDFFMGGGILSRITQIRLILGDPLARVREECASHLAFTRRFGLENLSVFFMLVE